MSKEIIQKIAIALHDTYDDKPIGFYESIERLLSALEPFIPKWVKVDKEIKDGWYMIRSESGSYEFAKVHNNNGALSWFNVIGDRLFITPDYYMDVIFTTHPYEKLLLSIKNKQDVK